MAQMDPVRITHVKNGKPHIADVKSIHGSKGKNGKAAEVSFPVFVPAGHSDAPTDTMQQLLNADEKVLTVTRMFVCSSWIPILSIGERFAPGFLGIDIQPHVQTAGKHWPN